MTQPFKRRDDRHAVVLAAGVEAILERETRLVVERKFVRKTRDRLFVEVVRRAEVRQRREKAPTFFRRRFLMPLLERYGVIDRLWNSRVVKIVNRVVRLHEIVLAQLVAKALRFFFYLTVVLEERQRAVKFSIHERPVDEEFARTLRIKRTVIDSPSRYDRQTVQRRAFIRVNVPCFSVPEGVFARPFKESSSDLFNPVRIDLRDRMEIRARRLKAFRAHDPLRLLLESGAGPNHEFSRVRRAIFRADLRFLRDSVKEPRQNRPVNRRVIVATRPQAHIEPAQHLQKLHVNVRPFAHTVIRKEIFATRFAQLTLAELLFESLPEIPKLEEGEEVGVFVLEGGVFEIRRLLFFARAFARILDFERRGDRERLAKRSFFVRREDDAPNSRVDGKFAQRASDVGEFAVFVDRAELKEGAVSVLDRGAARRIDEGEAFHVAETERFRLQNDRREVRSLDFRRRVPRARKVVSLAIKPCADAGPDASATPRALIRARLRDRFDRKTLSHRPRRIPTDSRSPRVDDVRDSRHGQGRFRDVRRHDDLATRRLAENLLLFLRRKTRVEGKDLRRTSAGDRNPFEELCRLENIAFRRHEDEHISGPLSREFLDRFDERRFKRVFVVELLDSRRPRRFRLFQTPRFEFVHRTIDYVDRVRSPRDGHDRRGPFRSGKVFGEAFRVDRRGGDDHLEIAATSQRAAKNSEEEIDIEGAFVRFVDDDDFIRVEKAIRLRLREEDTVRHEFDEGTVGGFVGKTNFEADLVADGGSELFRDALSDRPRSDTTRLRVPDEPARAESEFEAQLRKLRRFAAPRFAADDDYLILRDEFFNFFATFAHGQGLVVS